MNIEHALRTSPAILTEGAVVERLRRNPATPLDPELVHAGFIYDETKREVMARLFREYLAIGCASGLPMLCFTPTWRATSARVRRAGRNSFDVNGDCYRFLDGIRSTFGTYAENVSIGGLIGCRGDAYRAADGLAADEAETFHRVQLESLSRAGVDFLFGATLPSAPEATGIARAMSSLGLPYVLSFIILPDGCLLDGTPLGDAVGEIDDHVRPEPAGYMLNCVHASTVEKASREIERVGNWLLGVQANTSPKSPKELDGLAEVDSEMPELFAEGMLRLHSKFGLKVLGGCCGSDTRHIAELATRLRRLHSFPR